MVTNQSISGRFGCKGFKNQVNWRKGYNRRAKQERDTSSQAIEDIVGFFYVVSDCKIRFTG